MLVYYVFYCVWQIKKRKEIKNKPMSYLINSLMISALIPAFSNSGATCFKYTSRAWPFLLLGLITTFNLRGLPEMPETNKK